MSPVSIVCFRTRVTTRPHWRSAGLTMADTLLCATENGWRTGAAPTSQPLSARTRDSDRGWWTVQTKRHRRSPCDWRTGAIHNFWEFLHI